MFGKASSGSVTPLESPLCFPLDTGDSFYRSWEVHFFCEIFDATDVLDGDLKAVEVSGFRQRDLCGKVAAKIFIDDAIRCR